MGWFKVKQQAIRLDMIIGRPAVLAGRYLSSKPKYFLAPADEPSTSLNSTKTTTTYFCLVVQITNKRLHGGYLLIYHRLPLLASPNPLMTVLAALADPLLRAPP